MVEASKGRVTWESRDRILVGELQRQRQGQDVMPCLCLDDSVWHAEAKKNRAVRSFWHLARDRRVGQGVTFGPLHQQLNFARDKHLHFCELRKQAGNRVPILEPDFFQKVVPGRRWSPLQ